jgi:hypothetical protein
MAGYEQNHESSAQMGYSLVGRNTCRLWQKGIRICSDKNWAAETQTSRKGKMWESAFQVEGDKRPEQLAPTASIFLCQ